MFDAEDPINEPATQAALDIHEIDGALSHLRELICREPYLAGLYRDDFAEIAAEFQQLAQH